MDNVRNIAWLLMRVQLNKLSTFIFWIGLPIIFTFILSQQLVEQTSTPEIQILSIITANNSSVSVSLAQTPLLDAEFNKSTPGMMVMFTLIFMLNNAVSLIWERDQGTLRRLQVLPLNRSSIIIGKLVGTYLMGILQLIVLAMSNLLIFDLFQQVNLFGLLIMILVFGFTAASLGMLIAAISRSQEQASALTLILVFCISALGGAWWPLEVVPGYMQSLATALPTYWALNGFHQVMYAGAALADIVKPLLILTGFGVLFLFAGISKFKY